MFNAIKMRMIIKIIYEVCVISLIALNDRRAGKWGDLTETEIAHLL
jgi:hypothetical protein